MSFIVKEIDLPKDTEGISITFYTADGWRETHILDVTQAIQIPTPHGRLIDELKRHRDEYANDHGWNTSVLESLDVAITILEAEEDKNI